MKLMNKQSRKASLKEKNAAIQRADWDLIAKHGSRYRNFDLDAVRLILKFIQAYNVIGAHISSQLRRYGLSPTGLNVLIILSRTGAQGRNQCEISRFLLVSRANITGVISPLVKKGLVIKAPDSKDHRAFNIRISAKGTRLLSEYLPLHYADLKRIVKPLKQKKARLIEEFFDRIKTGIS